MGQGGDGNDPLQITHTTSTLKAQPGHAVFTAAHTFLLHPPILISTLLGKTVSNNSSNEDHSHDREGCGDFRDQGSQHSPLRIRHMEQHEQTERGSINQSIMPHLQEPSEAQDISFLTLCSHES